MQNIELVRKSFLCEIVIYLVSSHVPNCQDKIKLGRNDFKISHALNEAIDSRHIFSLDIIVFDIPG